MFKQNDKVTIVVAAGGKVFPVNAGTVVAVHGGFYEVDTGPATTSSTGKVVKITNANLIPN
jgi:hypothetical protein